MYTGVVFGITMLILGFLISLVGLQLFTAALLPRAVQRTREALDRPVLSIGTGLGVTVALSIFIGIANGISLPALGAFGLAITVLYSMVGLAALSQKLGERMPSATDATQPWRATMRGSITMGLAFLAPFVGWLGVLPIALIAALGATTVACTRSLFGGRTSSAPAEPARVGPPTSDTLPPPPPAPEPVHAETVGSAA